MVSNYYQVFQPVSRISANRLWWLAKVGKIIILFFATFAYYFTRAAIIAGFEQFGRNAKLLLKVGLALAGLGALWIFRQPVLGLLAVISDRAAVIAYLQQFGLWGPALLTLFLILQVIVAAIPGHALMIGGAYVYGFTTGFFINLISTVGASQCAYALARWAGRPVVVRLAPAHVLDKWNKAADQKGAIFFFFAFMLPIFPSDVMNFVAGLSSLSPKRFLAANFLGRLPGVILLTSIGAYGFELPPQVWIVIVVAGAGMFLAWWYFIARDEMRVTI